jgi:RecA-family ATPase
VQWLVDGLMPAGYVLMLFSPEGVGKTILTYNLAIAIASGTKFLGLDTIKGTVLYLDEENPDNYVHDSLNQMCRARQVAPASLADRFLMGRFALLGMKPEEWCSRLERTVEQIQPTLLVFDTFSSLLPFKENVENDAALMKGLLRFVRMSKVRSPSTTILILHHPPRSGNSRPRGTGVIGQDVDGYFSLTPPRGRPKKGDSPKQTYLVPGKARCLSGIPSYKITPLITPGQFDLRGEKL